jgi:hypothetical protein
MHAKPPVMVINPAHPVLFLVRYAVVIQDASRNAANHVVRVQKRNVCLVVSIVHVPCRALLHATIFHVLNGAIKSLPVVIDVHQFAGKLAPKDVFASFVEAKRLKTA